MLQKSLRFSVPIGTPFAYWSNAPVHSAKSLPNGVCSGYNSDGQVRTRGMGLLEKSKNITDTDLRVLVQESPEPEAALRRHILSLEESQRQLKSSQGFLARQCTWLERSAERKLELAEEWDKRALTAARQNRDDLAKHALLRKKELLRSMSEDRRQLERILPQLREVEDGLSEVRRKIAKSRAVRAKLFDADDADAAADAEPDGSAGPGRPAPVAGASELTEREQAELDEELKDLKRRLNSDDVT